MNQVIQKIREKNKKEKNSNPPEFKSAKLKKMLKLAKSANLKKFKKFWIFNSKIFKSAKIFLLSDCTFVAQGVKTDGRISDKVSSSVYLVIFAK